MVINREEFRRDIYSIVRQIPEGQVCTYGMLARLAGWPLHARMVGQAMAGVSQGIKIPCHRVVNAQGRIAPHWPEQRQLLEAEGVIFKANGCVDLRKYRWKVLDIN